MIERIKKAFQQPLPGSDFQFKMAHKFSPKSIVNKDKYLEAATLLLMYQKEGHWYFVLQKRASKYKGDKHAGQISFPGGKTEKSDKSLAFTALRETQEEMGINMEDISIIGELTPLHITVSKFKVYPFVGIINYEPQFVLQEDEVDETIEIPINHLLNNANKKQTQIKISEHVTINDVPYYAFGEHIIWGATAMILSEFEALI